MRLPDDDAARRLISRSILAFGVYELWGAADTYQRLHEDVRRRSQPWWPQYKTCSFRFTVIGFQIKRPQREQRDIIESFSYTGFDGPIVMNNADAEFCVFEDYELDTDEPRQLYLARHVGGSVRDAITEYDLKKRHYISTTSMDSELALVTANLAHAGPGRFFFDPFVGTGSFPIACAYFGATSIGADIDGRSIRGKKGRSIVSNFQQYGTLDKWLDSFISDLTHSPLRHARLLDGIICDPPYGVREGLKVLGSKAGKGTEPVFIDGKPAHMQEGFIPPKRPYSFEAMMDDILHFGACMLTDNGRLCLWMPTANDEEIELAIPRHECLELVSVCIQQFNKWARRLLTYRRLAGVVATDEMRKRQAEHDGSRADDLNAFRRKVCCVAHRNFTAPANRLLAVLPRLQRAVRDGGRS